jgi:23S rRNA pseudouridine2605 synthase
MHPSGEVEREYRVKVRGRPTAEALRRLREGVMLEDGPARFDQIEALPGTGPDATFKVVLREGRNREVRRMWQAVGYEVARLARTRYGPVELPPDLPMGKWRLIPYIEWAAGAWGAQTPAGPPKKTAPT